VPGMTWAQKEPGDVHGISDGNSGWLVVRFKHLSMVHGDVYVYIYICVNIYIWLIYGNYMVNDG
jgi:hypothetical protein